MTPAVAAPVHTRRLELDGIRGLAIALVLFAHLRIPGMERAGMVGVTLFFVLSGYLITGILLRDHAATGRVSLRDFYERRIRRLVPALVAVVLFVGVIMVVQGQAAEYPADALPAVFYVGNWFSAAGVGLGYLTNTWSLSIEEQFYLVWPLVFILLAGRRSPMLIVLVAGIAASIALRFVFADNLDRYAAGTDTRGDAILLGCLLAVCAWRFPTWTAIPALLVLAMISTNWHIDAARIGLTASALAALFVVSTAWRGFAWPPLVRLGVISYGLYLWHSPLIVLFDEQLRGYDGPVVRIVAQLGVGAASIGLALISERWIERPFRKPSGSHEPRRADGVGRVVIPGPRAVPSTDQ